MQIESELVCLIQVLIVTNWNFQLNWKLDCCFPTKPFLLKFPLSKSREFQREFTKSIYYTFFPPASTFMSSLGWIHNQVSLLNKLTHQLIHSNCALSPWQKIAWFAKKDCQNYFEFATKMHIDTPHKSPMYKTLL